MPDGGWKSASVMHRNFKRQSDFYKAGNPSALAPINPPGPGSAQDQELDGDLIAMGITPPAPAPSRRGRARNTRTSRAAAANTLPEIYIEDVASLRRPMSMIGPRLSELSLEQLPESHVRGAVDGAIHPPDGGEMVDVENELVDKMLARMPKWPTKNIPANPRDVEYEGIPSLFAAMRRQVQRQDARDRETLARTATRDENGADTRSEREKEAVLATEWHETMRHNAEKFFEDNPAVNSKAWRQKRAEMAKAAKEAEAVVEKNSKKGTKMDMRAPPTSNNPRPRPPPGDMRRTRVITRSQARLEEEIWAEWESEEPETPDEESTEAAVEEPAEAAVEQVLDEPAEEPAPVPAVEEDPIPATTTPEREISVSQERAASPAEKSPRELPANKKSRSTPAASPSPATSPSPAPAPEPTSAAESSPPPRQADMEGLSTRRYILRDYLRPNDTTTAPLLDRSLARNARDNTHATTTHFGQANIDAYPLEPLVGTNNLVLAHPLPIFRVGAPAPEGLVLSFTEDGREGVRHEAFWPGRAADVDWRDERAVDALNRELTFWLCAGGCHRAWVVAERARWLWCEDAGLVDLVAQGFRGEALYREFAERWAGRVVNTELEGVWRDVTVPLRSERAVEERVERLRRGKFTVFGLARRGEEVEEEGEEV